MQILGIGPLEFLFILVIMILVLGPKGMVRAARGAGKAIRKLTRSSLWAEIVGTSHEVRSLPARIIKEAGIEEEVQELRRSTLPPAFPQDGYPLPVPAATIAPKSKPASAKSGVRKVTPKMKTASKPLKKTSLAQKPKTKKD